MQAIIKFFNNIFLKLFLTLFPILHSDQFTFFLFLALQIAAIWLLWKNIKKQRKVKQKTIWKKLAMYTGFGFMVIYLLWFIVILIPSRIIV